MIETPRLLIRPFAPDDWQDLYAYLSDPQVVAFEPYAPFTEEQCKQEAARRAADGAFWAVCLRQGGRLIGNLYLAERDFGAWELGYVFNARYQGRGYAAESVRTLIQHAFAELGARRIVALCNPENERSWKLLERLGLRREGHLRQNIYFKTDKDGTPLWQDTYEYALLAEEWRPAAAAAPTRIDGPAGKAALPEESEVLAQLLDFAARDARIRVVLLNGSRVNPTHAPDLLSDYDVLLAVTDVDSFARDEGWIAQLGTILLMQKPHNPPPQRAWLVVFENGVRIDFTLSPLEQLESDARADSLTRVLYDPEGLCPPLPPPDESSHYVKPPTQEEFAAACNEFWWVLVYAAKGLWRRQLPYAKHALDGIVRPEMMRLLTWWAAAERGWRFNPGAAGKYLPGALPAGLWREVEASFAGANFEENWRALFAAARLVERVAPDLAARLGYPYDAAEGAASQRLLAAIRIRPSDVADPALR